ncbi:MAG: substrate-binding periplasmic protein [Pseudomonadales bacterium]
MLRLFSTLCLLAALHSTGVNAQTTIKLGQVVGSVNQQIGALLLKEVYRRAAVELDIIPMTAKRSLAQSSSGRLDGEVLRIAGLSHLHPELVQLDIPLFRLQSQVFANPEHRLTIRTRSDLKNLKTVITSGVLHAEALAQAANITALHRLPSEVKMLKFLSRGRVQIAIASRLNGLAAIESQGIDNIVAVGPPLMTQPMYHYLHQRHAALVVKLSTILNEMRASGELDQLTAKFEREVLQQSALHIPQLH